MPPAPSGRQTLIAFGDQQAVIVEVGGGLRTYSAAGIDVIDGYAEDEVCSGARGHPLIPWPNRIDGGRYTFNGVEEQVPLNEPSAGNAIHGLTSWASWSLVDSGTDHATLGYTLRPQPGWEWTLDLTITYALGPDGLRVTTTAINRSAAACPFGVGFHPYFRPPSGRVEDVELLLPAAAYDVPNERNIPIGRAAVAGTEWDFTAARKIGDLAINLGFTDLERDADGVATFVAADPARNWKVSVLFEREWDWAVVFTGDTLPSRGREGIAIEPMTGPANLFRTGEGMLTLEPGQPWEASWSIVPGWI